jgi:hypothetical protein
MNELHHPFKLLSRIDAMDFGPPFWQDMEIRDVKNVHNKSNLSPPAFNGLQETRNSWSFR